jgi:pilus assembly protein FimV
MVKKIVFACSVVVMVLGIISVAQSRTLGAEPFSYRVIMLNDSLWKISREVKPEAEVSRNQIMIAILRKNPDGFRGGNINYIKTGAELMMPTLAEAQAEMRERANALVEMHKSAWRAGQIAAPGLYELPGMAAAPDSRSAPPRSQVRGYRASA